MRMPPLPADSIHARACKLKCEKILTRPTRRQERAKGGSTRSTSRRAGAQEPVPGMWREVFKNNVDGARWKAAVLWNRARADPTSHVLT